MFIYDNYDNNVNRANFRKIRNSGPGYHGGWGADSGEGHCLTHAARVHGWANPLTIASIKEESHYFLIYKRKIISLLIIFFSKQFLLFLHNFFSLTLQHLKVQQVFFSLTHVRKIFLSSQKRDALRFWFGVE